MPIEIPAGVTATIGEGNFITVKGPKGTLERKLVDDMNIALENNVITVERPSDLKRHKALHGLTRTLIFNMVEGVTNGYSKTLDIVGTGYRAAKNGNKIALTLGFSHPVEMQDPEGITSEIVGQNKIIVSGIDKKKLGSMLLKYVLNARRSSYKGKGIRYSDERVIRKTGKAGK